MYRTQIRAAVLAGALLLTTLVTAGPAMAYIVPRPPVPTVEQTDEDGTTPGYCPLRRVGTQLVRCDDLTGNGVAAPAHVTKWG